MFYELEIRRWLINCENLIRRNVPHFGQCRMDSAIKVLSKNSSKKKEVFREFIVRAHLVEELRMD